jgi:hypothetical protein
MLHSSATGQQGRQLILARVSLQEFDYFELEYDPVVNAEYWGRRPVTVVSRSLQIGKSTTVAIGHQACHERGLASVCCAALHQLLHSDAGSWVWDSSQAARTRRCQVNRCGQRARRPAPTGGACCLNVPSHSSVLLPVLWPWRFVALPHQKALYPSWNEVHRQCIVLPTLLWPTCKR